MKPPANAVIFKAGDAYGQTTPEEWGLLRTDGDQPMMPCVLHRPTGLVFGIAQDEGHSPDRLRVYAVPLGQVEDEFGNMRKIGKVATDTVGRNAIVLYLLEIGAWEQPGCKIEAANGAHTERNV